MNSDTARPLANARSDDLQADSDALAKKRKIEEDIKNLYEDFDAVMDDYEGTDYGGTDYEGLEEDEDGDEKEEDEDEREEDDEEEWYSESDLACSLSECESEAEEGDDDEIDEEYYDQYSEEDDQEEEMNELNDDQANKQDKRKEKQQTSRRDMNGIARVAPPFAPTPKVIILSNDNKKLCVERNLLSSHSEFFNDMFAFPASDLNINHSQSIFIDEEADVLAIMLSDLHELHVQSEISSEGSHDIATDYSVMLAHDKFQALEGRKVAECRLVSSLSRDPFAGFIFASLHDDLQLGRKAIKQINLHVGVGGRLDFWKQIADAKPSWQLALAQLVMPYISRHPDHYTFAGERSYPIATVKTNLKDIAAAFNPKETVNS